MFCNNKCFRYYSLMICKEKGDWGSERSERVMRWKDLEDYRVVCKFEDNLLKKKKWKDCWNESVWVWWMVDDWGVNLLVIDEVKDSLMNR